MHEMLLRRLGAALAIGTLFAAAGAVVTPAAAEDQPVDPVVVKSQVRASSPSSRELRGMDGEQLARALARCFALSTETYCLGLGFRDGAPDYAELGRATARIDDSASGDLSFGAWVSQRAQMSGVDRASAEQAEIDEALAGVEKAKEIRALIAQGRALEANAKARGRQVMLDPQPGTPAANAIMAGFQTRQLEDNYCGPATLQSIDWAGDGSKNSQYDLASNLDTGDPGGTGTSISSMVTRINDITTWDNYAGHYIVQSVANWNSDDFYWAHRFHLGDADPAPIVEHPKLLNQYFAYLDSDHGGHFQVGRGYRTEASTGYRYVRIFEVFNEADFTFGGNTTWGPREVTMSLMLQATKANSDHRNIGM